MGLDAVAAKCVGQHACELRVILDHQDARRTRAAREHPLEAAAQRLGRHGLGDPVGVAAGWLISRALQPRQNDHGDVLGSGVVLERQQGLPAAHARQRQVEQDDRRALACGTFERLLAAAGAKRPVPVAGEHLADDLEDVRIVVAHQDRRPIARLDRVVESLRQRGRQRDREIEDAALTEGALGPDATAVLLDNAARDCQAEPRATLLARIGGVDLLEAAEDRLELGARDAVTAIAHADHRLIALAAGAHIDRRARRRELDRVAEQVGQGLLQSIRVGAQQDRLGVGENLQPRFVGHRANGLDRPQHQVARIRPVLVHWRVATFDALDVQDVVDEPDQAVGVGDRDFDHTRGAVGDRSEQSRREQPERAADAG